MADRYHFTVVPGEKVAFPPEVRCRDPPRIRLEGIARYSGRFTHAQLAIEIVDQPEAYLFQLTAQPPLSKPLAELPFDDAWNATENAGRLRHFDVPLYLKNPLTWSIKEAFVLPGKRPFSYRRKAKPGMVLPVSYAPYGPWKLLPEQGPFDLATTVELDLPKRYTRSQPMYELVEDLFTKTRGVTGPAAITAFYGNQPGPANPRG